MHHLFMLSFNKPAFWRKFGLPLKLKGPCRPALRSKVQPEHSRHCLRLKNATLGNCTKVEILHVDVVVLLGPERRVTCL